MINREIFDNISEIEKSQTEILEDALKVYFEQNKILKSKLSEFQNLRDENERLKDENRRLNSELSQKTSELSHKENAINDLSRQSEDLEQIRKQFSTIDILPYYEKLSDRIKESLSNVFVNSDSVSLLSAGVQKSNLIVLYESLFKRIKEDSLENYEEQTSMLRRLFEIYNLGQKEPYILIDPAIGSAYNEEEHLIKGSELRGTISKVWLFGYKTIQGKVLKQAFVSIG